MGEGKCTARRARIHSSSGVAGTVDGHVKNLRRKLADCGVDAVVSVYGFGYRFEWPESNA